MSKKNENKIRQCVSTRVLDRCKPKTCLHRGQKYTELTEYMDGSTSYFFYLIISKLLGSCWIQHISRSLIRIPKSPVFIDLILKFHAFLCILAYTHRPQRSRGLPWEPPWQTASLVICNPSFSAWQLQAAQLGEAARVKSQSPNCCL